MTCFDSLFRLRRRVAGLLLCLLAPLALVAQVGPKAPLPPGAVELGGHAVNPARVLVRWKEKPDPATASVLASRLLGSEEARALGASASGVSAELYPTLDGVGYLEFDDAATHLDALSKGGAPAILAGGASSAVALSVAELKRRMAALEASGRFAYVEPDYILRIQATPTDAAFTDGRLWGLRNTGQSGGVAGIDSQVVTAWDLTTGSTNVVVAVIDSGIRHSHRDLAGNMWRNPGEIAGNGIDDDGNGFVDDVFGINAITRTGDPMDDNGHGSHCAGTIGGTANDVGDLVGVAWTVRLMGLKFLSATGSGNTSDSIRCIDYAIAKGAHIINGSYGGGGSSQAVIDAITRAQTAGILCVFAAGNESNNNDTNPAFPASYPQANIVSVAAIDRTGALANFSNFGATSVDLAAPGVQIFSCNFQNDAAYQTINGTSMATPHVAGVAALLKARFPSETAPQLRQRLLGSTRPLPSLQGRVATGGMVQARAAMDLAADGILEVAASVDPTPLRSGEAATITLRVTDLTPVTNATVTGTLGGAPLTFRDDGVAPDTRSGDAIYSVRATVPVVTGTEITLTAAITAPGKTNFNGSLALPVVARAANDNFAAATALDLAAIPLRTSNLQCSRETGEPAHAGNNGGRSIWFNWTAPAPGQAQFTTAGSNFDTLLAVYTGGAVNGLALVAANDDNAGSLQSAVTFTAAAGTTYRIAVDGFGAASGNVVLNAAFTPSGPAAAPPTFVRQPASLRVQQGETIRLSVEVAGSPAPTLQWLRDGVALADGGRIAGATAAELVITGAIAPDAGAYTVRATNTAGNPLSLAAQVTVDVALVRPANDDFADRFALVGAAAQTTGVNTGATAEPGEPAHAGGPALRSVWWTWTAPQTGTVAIDTFQSSFDTVLAVYRGGAVGALTLVAENNDAPDSRQSRVTFTAESGIAYAIAVDGAAGESGSIALRLAQGAVGGAAPTITRQPVDTPAFRGFPATLAVVATGPGPLAYQWWKDGAPLQGETEPFLETFAIQSSDAGAYFVVVSNAFGSTTSNTVNVTVAVDAAPPNDNLANAARIAPGGEVLFARLAAATRETGEPLHAGGTGGTLWWIWTAAATGSATISTQASFSDDGESLDTVLAVYNGAGLGLVAQNDDAPGLGLNSRVTFDATAGTTYLIAVGGFDDDAIGTLLLITPPAAAGGAQAAPRVLLQPQSRFVSQGDTAVFFVGVAGNPQPAIQWQVSTDGGATFTDLANGPGVSGVTTPVLTISNVGPAQDGRRYRARLFNFVIVTSETALLAVLPTPANDAFAAAVAIPPGVGAVSGGSHGATNETGEPEHAGVGEASIWWTWQAGFSGRAIIDTVGSTFDTVLAVYTGASVNALTQIAANDDFAASFQSQVDFTATAGTTYRIAVSGFRGDYGSVRLQLPSDLAPAITLPPQPAVRVTAAGTVTISAGATGSPAPAFRWQRSTDGGATFQDLVDGAGFSGSTTATLRITGATLGQTGQRFRVVVSNPLGSLTSAASTLTVNNSDLQMVNLATRAISLGGDRVIIPGFVIAGTGTKRVLIRAVGPKLQDFGVGSFLPDPTLSVFRQGEPTPLATNDNWTTQAPGRPDPAAIGALVGAFPLTPGPIGPVNDTLSAALVLDLPAGPYSTIARDTLDRSGIGIVEIYDVDTPGAAGPRLVNVANRGFVGVGDQVMIPGLVVTGSAPRRYLIRAVGPKLRDFGLAVDTLLADPRLSVVRRVGDATVEVASNDDWVVQTGAEGSSADVDILGQQVGAFALGPSATFATNDQTSAALVIWLEPGSYTVLVSGAGGGSGIAIAEVYEIP